MRYEAMFSSNSELQEKNLLHVLTLSILQLCKMYKNSFAKPQFHCKLGIQYYDDDDDEPKRMCESKNFNELERITYQENMYVLTVRRTEGKKEPPGTASQTLCTWSGLSRNQHSECRDKHQGKWSASHMSLTNILESNIHYACYTINNI